ncbi:MAG: hypothetical protein JWN21_2684 [Sphingomonas bacterium]|uniref:hypothetical protein n=1 Tax=Sphingomonas bacterium TaxID=1895847 RepID=UPI0026396C4B|nr:hypothetical protein [Sphingomonas bacterium]MDB5697141.1 hypothetical protein [Sphingomonas bacterium]
MTEATMHTSTPKTDTAKTGLADDFREHFSGDAPVTQKATSFAKARPWTSAAFLGVAALALANTFRGRRA